MTPENLIQFIKKSSASRLTIDNENTASKTSDFAVAAVKTHAPDTLLIIGAEIALAEKLSTLVKNIYILVEDTAIAAEAKTSLPKNVSYICGRATDLPVDYHSVDMAICADYLDLYDSSRLIDELKRALEFDGILMIASRVCKEEDLEGLYDELYRRLNPHHNDFYLVSDLKTILNLKEINPVNESTFTFATDIAEFSKKIDSITGEIRSEKALAFVDENREELKRMYKLNNNTIEEYYYTGLFRCQKPEFDDYEEEIKKVKKLSGIVE